MSTTRRMHTLFIATFLFITLFGCDNEGNYTLTDEVNALTSLVENVAQNLKAIGFEVNLDNVAIVVKSPDEMASTFNAISKESKQYASFGPRVAYGPKSNKSMFDDGANARLAFYDPNSRTIVFRQGASAYLTEGYLAHELTHVYQDQKWSFDSIWQQYQDAPSLEQFNITQFMIEGHAELVRQAYEQLHAHNGLEKTALMKSLGKITENDCLACKPDQSIADLPYLMGLRFVTNQYRNGGWPLVEKSLSELPSSTEQIIHPKKHKLDNPVSLSLPPFEDDKHPVELIFNERLGEAFLLKRLIALKVPKDKAFESSSGWDGDIAQLYESPSGQKSLVWRITFDRVIDAQQLESSLAMVSKPGETFRVGRTVDWVVSSSPELRKRLRIFLSKYPVSLDENLEDERTTLEQEISMKNDASLYANPYFKPKLVVSSHDEQ